ncbi:hypothetical protein RB195_000035 [Necator americanus]|uniref:Peptidase M12B propeptide domain-containing protein n=1 Tax=Necator americanus TaxID=51031 RepID=A0ABR1D9E6_NECAM
MYNESSSYYRSLPIVENADVVPLVQYLDSDSSARARLSRVAGDCIYRARVVDAEDSSIVNLCESSNGLYGLLALPDGVYTVEPISDPQEDNKGNTRHRPHLVHRFQSQKFHPHFDDLSTDTAPELVENRTSYVDATWEDVLGIVSAIMSFHHFFYVV